MQNEQTPNTIDMTPTWGEWGRTAKWFLQQGDTAALLRLWPDIARALAGMEALKALQKQDLTLAQLETIQGVMCLELFKQGIK